MVDKIKDVDSSISVYGDRPVDKRSLSSVGSDITHAMSQSNNEQLQEFSNLLQRVCSEDQSLKLKIGAKLITSEHAPERTLDYTKDEVKEIENNSDKSDKIINKVLIGSSIASLGVATASVVPGAIAFSATSSLASTIALGAGSILLSSLAVESFTVIGLAASIMALEKVKDGTKAELSGIAENYFSKLSENQREDLRSDVLKNWMSNNDQSTDDKNKLKLMKLLDSVIPPPEKLPNSVDGLKLSI